MFCITEAGQTCNERTSECITNDRGASRGGNRSNDTEKIHQLLQKVRLTCAVLDRKPFLNQSF